MTYIPALTIVPDPPRTGRLDSLVTRIHNVKEMFATTPEIALPGGKVIKLAECKDEIGSDQLKCEEPFSSVAACREEAGGKTGSECEKQAIEEYLIISGDDWSLDDDDDDDDLGGGDLGGDEDESDDDDSDDDSGDLLDGLDDDDDEGADDAGAGTGSGAKTGDNAEKPAPAAEKDDDDSGDLLDDVGEL